jgi:AbrB family looped-hinge helix DNA binding protein
METVTISPDFQIEIPRSIREAMGLTPGQRVQVFSYENRIEIVPVRRPAEMRGFLAGMSTDLRRDADRL